MPYVTTVIPSKYYGVILFDFIIILQSQVLVDKLNAVSNIVERKLLGSLTSKHFKKPLVQPGICCLFNTALVEVKHNIMQLDNSTRVNLHFRTSCIFLLTHYFNFLTNLIRYIIVWYSDRVN